MLSFCLKILIPQCPLAMLPVSLAMFSRIAIVMINGTQPAEAAVKELNGCSMQGHTLHVVHINRAAGGSHSQGSASVGGSKFSQNATKTQA